MKEYKEIYRQISLFDGIERNDLNKMLSCLDVHIRKYRRGEMIFQEGDSARYIGIVLTGTVQIVRDDYYGNRSIIATIYPTQLFAEAFPCANVSILPIGVYANRDTAVMLLDSKKILKTCSNACQFHHSLIYNLLQNVAKKNLLLNQKIQFTSKKTTKEKLMAFLMAQAKEKGSHEFTIDYDRQTLADYLGVERSAMCAELGKLRDEGYLQVDKKHFRILKSFE